MTLNDPSYQNIRSCHCTKNLNSFLEKSIS